MDSSNYRLRAFVFVFVSVFLIVTFLSLQGTFSGGRQVFDTEGAKNSGPEISKGKGDVSSWCSLPSKLAELKDGLDPSTKFEQSSSVQRQLERLSQAVRVATVSYDDNGDVGIDDRWLPFFHFHDVLGDLFPLVRDHVKVDSVNELGLLYTVEGSDPNLKPIMFTAHQDVVPAASPDKWSHPPFEPYYDGRFVWGRGAADCKNNLIGLLSVVEDLLSQDWKPKRTVLLAFGYDEETGGERGAAYIATEVERRYGKSGIAMVMDEGGMGLETVGDYAYALPAVAEKGYLDIILMLEVNGGHSSRPSEHSGIGIMSEMICAMEQNPFKPRLTQSNPFRGFLECQVRYTPNKVEDWLERALLKGEDEVSIGTKLAEARGKEVRFLMQTSQAVDIINGGEKANQLPESVRTLINYRIAPHDSIEAVKQHVEGIVSPIAKKHGIAVFDSFNADSPVDEPTIEERLILSSHEDLTPSPISPTSISDPVWSIFSGVVRHVFEDIMGKTIIPVGDIMTGNTDTKHYWNLTKNIYRFTPARLGARLNMHTIDERVELKAHVEGMRLYYDLMRAFQRDDL